MISKIVSLTNFGNYRSFQWGSNTVFAKRNLIYGWNYSGKTTLSRLFQLLAEPSLNKKWPGSKYEIELRDGTRIDDGNRTNSVRLKVFNRDFIQSNFQQEYRAPAVFVVGENTIHLRNRIARLNEHDLRVTTIKGDLIERQKERQKELDSLATTNASSTATLIGDKTYNRPKLLAEIDRIRASATNHVLSDEALQAKLSLIRDTQVWSEITTTVGSPVDLTNLHHELTNLLQKTVSNEAISKLKENRELESWVRSGLSHHSNSDSCEFCGSVIPTDRLEALQKHFSRTYEEFTSQIIKQLKNLETMDVTLSIPDERDILPDLRTEYVELKARSTNWASWARSTISEFTDILRQKQSTLESPLTCVVDTCRAAEGVELRHEINKLIALHNQKCNQIEDEKSAAKQAIQRHQAADFYLNNDVPSRQQVLNDIEKSLARAQRLLTAIANKRTALVEQIQSQSAAAQRINDMVQYLLPDNNISVVEIPGGSFEFRRDGLPANNLSDGEKTAITFAYFLAAIENNGASLAQTILFIDDPISSLDSNHIYAIYAIIAKRLDDCLQIFVSTHNSELYALLKDHWFNSRKSYRNQADACSYYTRRYWDQTRQQWNSILQDTPPLLRKYKSEYQFVFEQLHQFSTSQSPSPYDAYTSPNLLRKFLEAYLGFMKPCISKWSDKLDLLFDIDVDRLEVQKFADDASHLQVLSRTLQEPQFVSNAQNVVKKVLLALKTKDLPHYTSMCTVIGAIP